MSEKRTFYKPKDIDKFRLDVKSKGGQNKFSKLSGICSNQIYRYIKENSSIMKENAIIISNLLNVNFDEYFELVNVKENSEYLVLFEKDKSDLAISEEMICGLKLNIENRLLITHSKQYVNEIMKIVDDLIIESSYLGVHRTQAHKEKFIVDSITKRRNTK